MRALLLGLLLCGSVSAQDGAPPIFNLPEVTPKITPVTQQGKVFNPADDVIVIDFFVSDFVYAPQNALNPRFEFASQDAVIINGLVEGHMHGWLINAETNEQVAFYGAGNLLNVPFAPGSFGAAFDLSGESLERGSYILYVQCQTNAHVGAPTARAPDFPAVASVFFQVAGNRK